jgi:hypothetical protein
MAAAGRAVIDAPRLLAPVALGDSGVRPRRGEIVSVRPYPFPFRAAFALNNDVDSMSREAFEDWHGHVSGRGPTAYGPGLGLEVGDSFWVWAGPPNILALHRCYPDETAPPDSPDLPRIVELSRAGWLDTLHSLGNWRPPADGDRRRLGHRREAEYALDKLDRLGLKPRVYVNHSASPSNVGAIWGTYQRADDPDHALYCMDLYRAFGFHYYWVDAATSLETFGDHLAFRDDAELRTRIDGFKWVDWLRKEGKGPEDDPPRLPVDEADLRRLLLAAFNETIVPVAARDGAGILAFKRYRGRQLPSATTFCTQVTARDLDDLEARGGTVIVYQHFGVTTLRGRAKSKGPGGGNGRSAPPVLDEHALGRWRDIAARRDAGRLFVATTERLLDWLWRRDRLQITLERSPERWRVRLGDIRCPVLGDRAFGAGDLNGFALLIPETAPEVSVIDAGGRLLDLRREPDPAHPGRHALHRPWEPLEWIPP